HLQAGTLLQGGKYKIVRFIAAGGFGCTYEALHVVLKKRVAIKEFFVSDFCNRDSTGRVSVATDSKRDLVAKLKGKFYDEACAVASLDHTGIVHVSDVFEENGTAYFVMDYIDGRSLAEIVKAEGPMSEARALGYIRQVCAALQYVHSQNRLHLDIKPNNIMVTGNDRAILIDFGVSKQYDEASGENTSTLLGCTPGYAPPEQMSQNIKHFYPATDVYSLGATLYDLLTGEAPPDAAKRTSEEEELQPLSQAISAPTRAAVYAALELSKKKRPQSVAAFATMLDNAPAPQSLTDEPIEIVSPLNGDAIELDDIEPETTSPWYKRNVTQIAIAAIAVLACVIAMLSGGNHEPTYKEEVETPVEATTGSYNGHDWVDLGLSVKWATCNVGASSPTGYGDYYAWGEVSTKSEYSESNSRTYNNSNNNFNICGNSSYDVARYKWGSPWRLPSASEIKELIDNCTWEWMTMNGVSGYKVTSKRNSNYIFLPAAGWRCVWSLDSRGSLGIYWSGSPYEIGSSHAFGLYFGSYRHYRGWYGRYYGQSVRPVAE
ncbi:MAG: protein kinase, partial [Muribaculaceae bacterium]